MIIHQIHRITYFHYQNIFNFEIYSFVMKYNYDISHMISYQRFITKLLKGFYFHMTYQYIHDETEKEGL